MSAEITAATDGSFGRAVFRRDFNQIYLAAYMAYRLHVRTVGQLGRLAGRLQADDQEKALQIIDSVPDKSPFELRYDTIEDVDWESCSTVLDSQAQLDVLPEGW
jgi:hypothetical protein